ncbi:MAG TPA: metal-dependent hydrolase [Burkholderiales bacterium]|nr:metal-dependent hydrolase [Burkholderiales bacterium]
MDTLTHALSGALLARATVPAGRSAPRYVAAGFLACAAPDLDFLWTSGSALSYIEHHRGVTHSLVLAPLWALGLAGLLARILREPGGWREFYGISAAALALHIAGDLVTSFGTMILAPFSDWRAAIGTTFIIDFWFSGIIVAGLIFSAIFQKSRKPAAITLALLAGYVGFQYVLKERALEFARAHAREHGLAYVRAEPRPVSPFNWAVFASDDEKHDTANINLIREVPKSWHPGEGFIARLDAAYLPPHSALWLTRYRYGTEDPQRARRAWESDALAAFRWFAVLPVFDGREGDCYYFVDLRFATPGRGTTPFRFGACERRGGWRLAGAD